MGVDCAVGKYRMLYRVEEHRVLEVYRALACHLLAIRIQAWARMIFRHRQYKHMLKLRADLDTFNSNSPLLLFF